MSGWHNPQLAELLKATKDTNKPPKFSILKILGLGLWGIITLAIGAYLGAYFTAKFAETKQLTIPTSVYQKGTNNVLHLEIPIPHKTYYEYPITIHDGKNSLRIDMYGFADRIGYKFSDE